MILEQSIEQYLVDRVEGNGGLCIKLVPTGRRGIPDRLVILPRGYLAFVELKKPKNGVLAKLQKLWQSNLRKLGQQAHVISTKEEVDALIANYHAKKPTPVCYSES